MSRLAREHPEDERYQSLDGQREVLADLADLQKPSEIREALGVPEAFPQNVHKIEVIEEPSDECPYCGTPWDEEHRPGCRLYVGDQ